MEAKICEYCGVTYLPKYRVTKSYWARRKFCSEACRHKGTLHPGRKGQFIPLEDRFWPKVMICAHGTACRECCWLWIGSKDAFGYGVLYRTEEPKRTVYKAHRLAYELFVGPIPEGLHVLHDCPTGDNPACVNYNGHLWVGTQADNNRDRDRKGRHGDRHGMRNGRTIVSDADVLRMRELYGEGGRISQAALGDMFGCSEAQAQRIVTYKQRVIMPTIATEEG